MRLIKRSHAITYINKDDWHTCKMCDKTISQLAKIYGGCGVYFPQVMKKHLEVDHNITTEEYFENICKLERPLCSCNICCQKCNISRQGGNFVWRKYVCGLNNGVKRWSEEAKTTRQGSNNPMFGGKPWNKGETKQTSSIIAKIANDRLGTKASEATRKKQSDFQKNRKIEPHLGHKHTPEMIEKFRQITLDRIKSGFFKQLKSKCHIEFGKILTEENIKFEEEKIIDIWSFDYYLKDIDIYIEVDGDYFHSNPLLYPNGPKTNTQKINWSRDLKKNKYCDENNMRLIRFWENDILNNKELIRCKVKELFVSNQSEKNEQ